MIRIFFILLRLYLAFTFPRIFITYYSKFVYIRYRYDIYCVYVNIRNMGSMGLLSPNDCAGQSSLRESGRIDFT